MSHGIFEQLESSDSEIRVASKHSQQKLAAAIYDVKAKYGDFLNGASALDEFHDRVALVKNDMLKTVDQHLMPVTGVMRRVVKACKDEWRKTAADEHSRYVHEDEVGPADDLHGPPEFAFYKERPKKPFGPGLPPERPEHLGVFRRQADKTGPAMHIDNTFSPSSGDLVPEGDFKGYLDSVDQGAESKISDRFEGGDVQRHEKDPADTDFTKNSSLALQVFSDWCESEGLRTASIDSLDKYAENLSDDQYFKLAAELQRTALGLGGLGNMADIGGIMGGMGDLAQQGVGMISGLAGGMGGGAGAPPPPAGGPGGPGPTNDLAGAPSGVTKGGKRRRATAKFIHKSEIPGVPAHDEAHQPQEFWDAYSQHRESGYHPPAAYARAFAQHGVAAPEEERLGKRRVAQGKGSTDYLQKADEALTNLLNQKAEEFQESVQALQQALQTVQQAEQAQAAMNPMSVQPPAGTVNILPGQDAAAAGGMPPAGGDMTSAAGGAAGMPPDPTQMMASRHNLDDPGECKGGDESDPPGQSAKTTTKDWHSRDKNQRWVSKGGKRQGGAAPFA